jgi:hypothetical protein
MANQNLSRAEESVKPYDFQLLSNYKFFDDVEFPG